jgi:hypothetical protein
MGKALAACAALLLSAASLAAEEFQWCVKLDAFTQNCAFTNYNDCVATAASATTPATGVGRCVQNPSYQPPTAAASARPKPASAKPAPAKTASPQPANPQR